MRKLSQLVIKTFLGPFLLTFILILFILLMQFVWKYLDDLMGKGLDLSIIMELLLFQSTNLVQLALPLAVLLSSIMTFGNLAENYELVALKSSGLSLFRIMRPLIVLIFLIAIGAFFFSNHVTPYANLKSRSLLYDIVHQKPLLEVKEGVFYNGLEGYSIRVGKKDVEDETMHDVLIYDHRDAEKGNSTVIRAQSGRMDKTLSGRYILFRLFDGDSYDEQGAAKRGDPSMPFVRSEFKEMVLRIDLSSFDFKESDEEQWTNNIPMQNLSQLSTTADSLTAQVERRKGAIHSYLQKNLFVTRDSLKKDIVLKTDVHSSIDSLSQKQKERLYRISYNMVNNSSAYLKTAEEDLNNRRIFINKHWNEWHRKFTLSFACIVLFFIGAPLGAIIKKGGLGLPVVFSIIFFLIFHISSITGEKMSNSGSLEPFEGMWLSTSILTPIAVFLTYKAANDSALFDRGTYEKLIKRMLSLPKRDNR
jgi:lipopolysaccharide export system permease protein